jgi:hypothetical protein
VKLDIARGSSWDRAVWIGLAFVAGSVLATARVLAPDPIRGSSAQLGIPPCGFQTLTGFKCPGCGLTTAFAYLAHFDVVGAFHANAFGILLFLVTLAFVPFALYAAWRGWSIPSAMDRLQGERVVIALALLCLANWLVRFGYEWTAAS